MDDVTAFGGGILLVSAALTAALFASKLSERVSVPAAAPFLVVAAVASDIFPGLVVSNETVIRVATVALIVILFDGGLSIGWRRFRESAVPISLLGIVGTFATAGGVALFAHYVLGLGWTASGLLGAAVAPTDPAVMFSVLGDREVSGRTGTILEGGVSRAVAGIVVTRKLNRAGGFFVRDSRTGSVAIAPIESTGAD